MNILNGMSNVESRAINRAEWDEKNPDHSKRANPLWFDGMFRQVRRRWIDEGAVFGRKVRHSCADEKVSFRQPCLFKARIFLMQSIQSQM